MYQHVNVQMLIFVQRDNTDKFWCYVGFMLPAEVGNLRSERHSKACLFTFP